MCDISFEHRDFDTSCCGVILSGGLNSRMGGRTKAFLSVGGKSILALLLESIQPVFDEILLVTRHYELYLAQPVRIVTDVYPARSSLTGIHAGLLNANAAYAFILPCDAPFLRVPLIQLMIDALDPKIDIVVPYFDGHYQPLCAIYSKRCLPEIELQLDRNEYKIIKFFDKMAVKKISGRQIRRVDPDLRSFFNVNTPADLRAGKRIFYARLRPDPK